MRKPAITSKRPFLQACRSVATVPQQSGSPLLFLRRYAAAPQRSHIEPSQLKKADDEGSITADKAGLFKLLLPLAHRNGLHPHSNDGVLKDHVLFLLHPRQPLSYIANLIEAETALGQGQLSKVYFHGKGQDPTEQGGKRWAMSTDLGEFIQRAAVDSEFTIALYQDEGQEPASVVRVKVPSFEERTQFMRSKLLSVSKEMRSLLEVKRECDDLAVKAAQRYAVTGFAGFLGYWAVIYYLTFYRYGWDTMEPITYLTGLSGLGAAYLWFLYNQREASFRSVFELSSSKRREQLYQQRGFDKVQFDDLVAEATDLRRAVKRIAEDYDVKWRLNDEEGEHKHVESELDRREKAEDRHKRKKGEKDDD